MKGLIIVLLGGLILTACQNTGGGENKEAPKVQTPVDSLHNEVMVLHDITMEQMGQIGALKKQLVARQDSTRTDSAAIAQAILRLQKSHDDMMSWMRNFENVHKKEDWDENRKLEYLKTEEDKIATLKDYTTVSLEEASRILERSDSL